MQLAVVMMFAAVLGIGPGAPDAEPAPSEQRCAIGKHRNKAVTMNAKLEQGERVLAYLTENYGDEVAADVVRGLRERRLAAEHAQQAAAGGAHFPEPTDVGSQPTDAGSQPADADLQPADAGAQPTRELFPRGFWKRFITEELQLRLSDAKRMECLRALKVFLIRAEGGSRTRIALREGQKGHTCRNGNAANNRTPGKRSRIPTVAVFR